MGSSLMNVNTFASTIIGHLMSLYSLKSTHTCMIIHQQLNIIEKEDLLHFKKRQHGLEKVYLEGRVVTHEVHVHESHLLAYYK